MRLIKNIKQQEDGYVIIVVLIVLVLSGLIVAPLMGWMGTSLKSVRVYHENTDRLYASDAGVQNAIWKIINGEIPESYPFSMTYPAIVVNDKSTIVTVDASWILQGIADEKYGPHNQWVKMVTQGLPKANGEYIIDMNYTGNPGNKRVSRIGVWLPSGFTYEVGSCALYPNNATQADPTSITPANAGTSIIWENVDYPLNQGPHFSQTFRFSPEPPMPAGTIPIGDVAWCESLSQDIGLSYDRAIYTYVITSKATDISGGKATTVLAVFNKDTGSTAGEILVSYEIDPPGS